MVCFSFNCCTFSFKVRIKPFENVPHLGYDTVLFDSERNPLGAIFEVFGTVTNTMYAVRFNSKEEAEEKMPAGRELFYACDENITKTVFPNELAKLTFSQFLILLFF